MYREMLAKIARMNNHISSELILNFNTNRQNKYNSKYVY